MHPFELIKKTKVIPIYVGKLPPRDLEICEIAMRTDDSAKLIAEASKYTMVGAGTCLDIEALEKAINAGASFAITPITNEEVIKYAVCKNFPIIPGVSTANEIWRAMQSCRLIKFFPAFHIHVTIAPFLHRGVEFIATGSVTPENKDEYLKIKGVVAVTGTVFAK